MLFSSLPFLFCFMPVFFILYFCAGKRSTKNHLLLVFSLVFYAWGEPVYILLMVFSIAINYLFARIISAVQNKNASGKMALVVAVTVNLSLLGVFKYADFILGMFPVAAITPLNLPLPIGISFYTFQILSYVVDVYRKEVPAQRNILFLGAYLSGFPQLIAGPIVRYKTIADELINRKESYEDFSEGFRRFIAGLAKKVLIANNVAALADGILGLSANDYGAAGAYIAVISYSLQIYFDFSGYSDMAIGLGRAMGFHYLENFNYPYIAKSATDLWRRWHISLSTFFRDYVYIPLGGNRVSRPRWVMNMLIVWLLTGLWHGAAWTFVAWGLYYGAILVAERLFWQKRIEKLPVLCNIYTIAVILFGWVIFRAESLAHARDIYAAMFGRFGPGSLISLAEQDIVQLPYIIALAVGVVCSAPVSRRAKAALSSTPLGRAAIDAAALLTLILCVFSLAAGSYNPFIYFIF